MTLPLRHKKALLVVILQSFMYSCQVDMYGDFPEQIAVSIWDVSSEDDAEQDASCILSKYARYGLRNLISQ